MDPDPKRWLKLYSVQAAGAAQTPEEQFLLFFSEEMISKLVDYTNDKIADNHQVSHYLSHYKTKTVIWCIKKSIMFYFYSFVFIFTFLNFYF